ncbi:DUF4468 domain-containing protein [Arenibacter sp. F26102]|uniref:DUF4468 domain-containing protein n=1 Tax=Arenibacter sp. F26102 TaxID=2926416 RepID=UPI001FF2938F|nr:DUF4468 domain-containing protein [Arenibacter sp. F26102]MCK0147634.1 DUF4468 domain-containing protein [Arenibacter sp. F26102]
MIKQRILWLLLLFLGVAAPAQVNPDLYDMPTSDNVLLNIKGTDNIDTYVKQVAALDVLMDVAQTAMCKEPCDKKQISAIVLLRKEYSEYQRTIYLKFLKESNFSHNEEGGSAKWDALWEEYHHKTPDLKEEIIETLFNERAKNRYYEINGIPNTVNNKTVTTSEKIVKTTVPQASKEESGLTSKTTIKFGFDENYQLIPNPIIYQAPGVSKENLYNRALIWINKTFINPEEAIISNVKGEFIKIYGVEPLNKWGTSVLPYTIQLEFKEGRYKLTYSNLTLKDPQTLLNDKMFTEQLRSQTRNEQAAYNEKGFAFLDSIFKSINRELTGKNKIKDDW